MMNSCRIKAARVISAFDERLQVAAHTLAPIPVVIIRKLTPGIVSTIKALSSEAQATTLHDGTSCIRRAEHLDDHELTIDLAPESATRIAPGVNWNTFSAVCQIDETKIADNKKLAVKAVWNSGAAHSCCNSALDRRLEMAKPKVDPKSKADPRAKVTPPVKLTVAIMDKKYLTRAILNPIRLRAENRKLRKPIKITNSLAGWPLCPACF